MRIALTTVDPDAPLDDLEPLRALIGGARVVGIGESSHYVREYQLLRHRLLRFLVERMGFTAYAQESGFSEGLALGSWVAGAPGDFPADALTYRFGTAPETRRTFEWLRAHGTVSYTGLDLPGDLASMLPALAGLDAHLDPGATAALTSLRDLATRWAGPHPMPAFAAYLAMPQPDRDAQTVLLADLSTRMDALRPLHLRATGAPEAPRPDGGAGSAEVAPPGSGAGSGGPEVARPDHGAGSAGAARADRGAALSEWETARHGLRLAVLLDAQLRAQARAAGGAMSELAVNARDAAMAETARMLLARGERLVIGAANSHLTRTPPSTAGIELPTLGTHLAAYLGDDFVVIALTAATGRVLTRRRSSAPEGVEIVEADLDSPADGSIEALLAADAPVLADVRDVDACRTRVLDTYQDLPISAAYDFVACLPAVTPTTR
ncbi:erythromycin esterase [Catenuloplanes nepalensis]|uniref:Erythromycin esterase n=1 Tax=Catenuloplanes nepalensis TaxID=587533 RepID=A0ABT9MK28_9ACTN|nr:erythromycin esterase family protein [Catenuloplanes nepalensis]MDP9791764.1 erythromycin esterase [Catenuloplanes nepalensis]